MDTFKLLKLKNYFFHMIIGVAALLLGIGILQSIALEVLKEYDPASIIAYICGAVACAGIILYGLYEIIRAFNYEKRILKLLEPEEREQFYSELENQVELTIPGQVVMTKSFLLVPVKDASYVRVFLKDRLVGCFQTETHQEAEATEGEMVIYDLDFKAANVNIRGKGSTQAIHRLYERICMDMPWIYHEGYDDFLSNIRRSGYRRKLVKQMKDLKMRYETGYNSDKEAENELLAMSQDVKEKLNSHSLLERFLKKTK